MVVTMSLKSQAFSSLSCPYLIIVLKGVLARLTLCLGQVHFVTVLKRGKGKQAAVHHKLVLLHGTEARL